MLLQREIYIHFGKYASNICFSCREFDEKINTDIASKTGSGAVDGGGRQDDFSDLLRTGYRQAGRYRSG